MKRARDLIFKNSEDLALALIVGPGTPLTASAKEQLASLVPELRSKAVNGLYQAWLSYAGTQAERQSWAGGTLARIRATMAGFLERNRPLPADAGDAWMRVGPRTLLGLKDTNTVLIGSLLDQMRKADGKL